MGPGDSDSQPRSHQTFSKKPHLDPAEVYQPAITRTCRALRHELLPHYHKTRILLDANGSFTCIERVGRWLLAIGPEKRSQLRGIFMGFQMSSETVADALKKDHWAVGLCIGDVERMMLLPPTSRGWRNWSVLVF